MIDKKKAVEIKEKAPGYIRENKRVLRLAAVLIFTVLLTSHIKSCMREQALQKEAPRPVNTATTVKMDVDRYFTSFGQVAALNSVDVVARITGEITDVFFNEGQTVSEGDLLFTVDKRPYQAELDKTIAQLEVDRVDLELKRATYHRNKPLAEKDLISRQAFQEIETEMEAAAARVKLDEALVEKAGIDLAYCDIKASVSGVTGKRKVDKGNIVTANSGPVLVNIRSIDKVYVDFTVPERVLPSLMAAMDREELRVIVYTEEEGEHSREGVLESMDNVVDASTGTISLRALVPNGERALWPGQFVKVRLVFETIEGAVVVPYEAVQAGQPGKYVFVVKDKKAELRLVETGQRQGNDIVIEKGISEGDVVVTTGQMGLSPGAPVVDVAGRKAATGKRAQ